MASTKSRTKRNVDIISFSIPGHDSYQMTVKEIVSKIEKDRIENMDEAVHTLIAVWTTIANRTENLSNVADIFHSLFRKTSLTILSVRWIKVTSAQKRQMAKVLTKCSQVFGPLVEKATRLCTVLVMAVYDPWGEPALNQLVEGQINFTDSSVGEFVNSEPEELLLTRVESLTEAGHINAAIQLCKSCLRHCLAIMTKSEQDCYSSKKREKDKAYPFIENMIVLLHNQGEYAEVIKEAAKLKCHDGVTLIEEISSKCSSGDASLPEMLSHFFLARDINLSSTYCCTKALMNLWCKSQVMQQRSIQEVSNSAQRLICHASSSAHFYLFVDRLWCQFGSSLLPLYLEMYVRGITSDMNFLDVVRVAGPPEKTIEMESHLAFIFTKLASLFSGLYDEIALECLLTAYSFAPAKEKIDKIHKMKERVSKRINLMVKPFGKCFGTDNDRNLTGECTCEGRCSTPTKYNQNLTYPSGETQLVYSYNFPHLILDGEIKGVPYLLLKDFVSVLECMRYKHLRASDDWETIKRNCQEYLEKWTAPKTTETLSYDSADSEMDSVSEDGDDNVSETKLPRAEEIPHEMYSPHGKDRKELKPKSHRKQKHRIEESQDSSKHLLVDNDVDKEIKKRKKKRKTKREKDREAFLRKQFEDDNTSTLVHGKIADKERQSYRSSLQTFPSVKNEFADMSNQEMKSLITQVNSKFSGDSKTEESSLSSGNIQNKNPVVVLSDILSNTIIDGSRNNDGIYKSDFKHCDSDKTLPMELDLGKEIVLNTFETSSNAIVNSSDTVSFPQVSDKMIKCNKTYVEGNSNTSNSLLSSESQSNPSNEHRELPAIEQKSATIIEHQTAEVVEQKTATVVEQKTEAVVEQKTATVVEQKTEAAAVVEQKTAAVVEQKSYSTHVTSERSSESVPVPTVRPSIVECPADSKFACVFKSSKDLKENEQEKSKEDVSVNDCIKQVVSTASNSNCTITSIPLDSLPKKLQVQVERKGGISPMSSVATLSIPLPVGVKHSSGNKVLSGRLVIPVNRLQRAVSSATSNTIKVVEGDVNCNKQQMLSIPNVILMKRNISSDISDEETGSKKTNINRGSKSQRRMWATVRNLHGSIEWRKISGSNGGIAFQQKSVCAKLKPSSVALSGSIYMSSGKEVDNNDLSLGVARSTPPSVLNMTENCSNVASCSNTEHIQTVTTVPDLKFISSPVCVTIAKTASNTVLSSVAASLQVAVTDIASTRNDSNAMHSSKETNVSSNSFATTASVTSLGISHNALAVAQPRTAKPGITKKDHRLKFITSLDNTCNTNVAGALPVVTRTAVVKEVYPITSTASTEKCAKNIIRLMHGGAGICENNIDFTRSQPTVLATNICPQAAKSKNSFSEVSDLDLPVNLSMPKKPSTACVGNEYQEGQAVFDNKQYPLHHSQPLTNCRIDSSLPPPVNNSAPLFNKASSTLQMLLANSTVSCIEQNKCSDKPTSTVPVSLTRIVNNAVEKSLSCLSSVPSVSLKDLPLDFKKAYPNTNINCFVGLSPLNTYPSNEAKISAIVASNTSKMKKEQIRNMLPKGNSSKPAVTDSKEPFDVVKLIGQIRELAEAEKAAKTKEKRKTSKKNANSDNRNRKLSKKCIESNDKTNLLIVPKKYSCVICSSSLVAKYSLKRHYRDVHGLEVNPEQSSESIVKQFNDIASSRGGINIVKSKKRSRTKVNSQTSIVTGGLLSLADAAENEMQKKQQTLPGVDVAFSHLNIFHSTNSQVTSLPSDHTAQSNLVPMFSAASTSTSYYPEENANSSVLKWSDNNPTISSAENTLEALVLDNTFYNNRVSDKPLPDLGDCHSDLNESKHIVSTSNVSLPVPSSFYTGNINFKGSHVEHGDHSRAVVNKNNEFNLLAINSNKTPFLAAREQPLDVDRTCRTQTPERKFETDDKMTLRVTKEWSSKDLKQISVNCIKLDNIYNQTTSSLEIGNSCINPVPSHSKPGINYQNTGCFSVYHNRKQGERVVDGSSDNAVDSEVSKLVAHMLHIGKESYTQQKHLVENLREDCDGETKLQESSLHKQEKNVEENKSEALKSVRQRTRVRHSPNSSLKRSCPCCQNSEASTSAKKCRNISNVSRLARPFTVPWVNLERAPIRRSRKSLPSITTRSSKRLRTRSSTSSLT